MEESSGLDVLVADETSNPFVGQWTNLVSSTNWEKGSIIHQWREALIESGASPQQYSDDSWARRVGGGSGQHVGRLRRVHERFIAQRTEFPGLYWSHFQAALDWQDAEMWLEGAVQNGWSVSVMRHERWQALGAISAEEPRDEQPSSDFDEDFVAAHDSYDEVREPGQKEDKGSEARGESFDLGDESSSDDADEEALAGVSFDVEAPLASGLKDETTSRPFADLPELPEDLSDAFDSFKLAIVRHRMADWSDVSKEDVLLSLDALKQLVLAPSGE